MKEYSTLRAKLRCISQLAQEEPLNEETQDAIGRASHEALRELDQLELNALTARPALTLSLIEEGKEALTR